MTTCARLRLQHLIVTTTDGNAAALGMPIGFLYVYLYFFLFFKGIDLTVRVPVVGGVA